MGTTDTGPPQRCPVDPTDSSSFQPMTRRHQPDSRRGEMVAGQGLEPRSNRATTPWGTGARHADHVDDRGQAGDHRGRSEQVRADARAVRPHDEQRPHRKFSLQGGETVEVAINAVGRESGDGESWLIEGYIPGTDTVILDGGTRAVTPEVDGYYNTRRNQGWLKRGVIR